MRRPKKLAEVRAAMKQEASWRDKTTAVLDEIELERIRQVKDEGWTAEHDDGHDSGQLARAGATYAYAAGLSDVRRGSISGIYSIQNNSIAREIWPFEANWWKLRDRRRDLIRAAALQVAEIERLDRAAGQAPGSDGATP